MSNQKDQPRLIEVAFPLRQASLASVHEKNVRHGHISTLHIWPARRPLAACRAALLATLLPDPGDPKKRKALLEKIGGSVVKEQIEKKDADGKTIIEGKEGLEDGVLAWGRENDPSMDEFRVMIREFYGDEAPKVMDPFAGGGAIPLEAWGREVPLILEMEPGVEFRKVAKLFITSFDRPSFEAIRGKEAVNTEEKSVVFKETPKKLSFLS